MVSRGVLETAIYSISQIDKIIINCLFDFQTTDTPAPRNTYSLINLQITISPVQLTFK
jgi:hypothetical protein